VAHPGRLLPDRVNAGWRAVALENAVRDAMVEHAMATSLLFLSVVRLANPIPAQRLDRPRRLARRPRPRPHPARPGRFVFVSPSALDAVDGRVLDEAAGPLGVLGTVQFARGKTDEGLDVLQPIVIEGVLLARSQFSAVVELQVREARRVP
jgi:hypothetical protein